MKDIESALGEDNKGLMLTLEEKKNEIVSIEDCLIYRKGMIFISTIVFSLKL